MAVQAPKFEDVKDEYERDWENLTIRGDRLAEVTATARNILTIKLPCVEVERETGVPWFVTALICYRESTLDLTKWIGNGDPLNQVSTHAPAGEGPFSSWKEGAIRALTMKGYAGAKDWGIARICYRWEAYNGFGPRVKHGIKPSYLYGGSTLYGPPEAKGGKYVKDGPEGWDPDHVDKQLGVVVLLKMLL
jgi:lysozyme family protein